MRNRFVLSIIFVGLGVSFSNLIAQGNKSDSDVSRAKPSSAVDFSGVWVLKPPTSASPYSNFVLTKDEPAMTAWGEQEFKGAKPIFGPNKTSPQESNDPVYGCFPAGLPRIYLQGRPMEIIQTPTEVIIAYQYGRLVRHIYTDGRGHDDFIDPPLWMGDSIGRWEGDALVVDVIGFNDKTWLDRVGHRHSDALHVVERFRRPDRLNLVDEITIEDAKAYTKPWMAQLQFQLKPGADVNWEEVCETEKLRERQ